MLSYFRHAAIVATLMLCAVLVNAQDRQRDTIPVIILVSDTSKMDIKTAFTIKAFSVREKHNTDEGQVDPYFLVGYASKDYWVHLLYLDGKKKIIKEPFIVWMVVSAK